MQAAVVSCWSREIWSHPPSGSPLLCTQPTNLASGFDGVSTGEDNWRIAENGGGTAVWYVSANAPGLVSGTVCYIHDMQNQGVYTSNQPKFQSVNQSHDNQTINQICWQKHTHKNSKNAYI